MIMSSSKCSISDPLRAFKQVLLHKMQRAFLEQRDSLIKEYQDKLKFALVGIAAEYAIQLNESMDDYNMTQRLEVEVIWPNETTDA